VDNDINNIEAIFPIIVCFYRKVVYEDEAGDDVVRYEDGEGARMHFIKFETKHIDQCLDYIRSSLRDNIKDMKVSTTQLLV